MTALLARPEHWDDPDPVPGFDLRRRRSDLGVGEVWEAVAPDGAPALIRLVALADDAVSRAKAVRLAEALPQLGHPDLEQVRQVILTLDGLALVRPLADRGTTSLSALLTRRRSISAAEVAGLADRLGRALGYLHDNGVTHGRLSADDVLLRPNGLPVLTGFGVAGIQGAGGLPGEDIAALASLLLSARPAGGGPEAEALRAVLASAVTSTAAAGADGHAFADKVLTCSDPAPIRMRPTPGRPVTARSTNRQRPNTGRRVQAVSVSESPTRWLSGAAPDGRAAATDVSPSAPAVATLDSAVRALRAGARQSAARHRSQPSRRGSRSPAHGPASQRAGGSSQRRSQSPLWLRRIAPAAVILLVTILVGWRFVGPAATAGARPVQVSATVAAPDRATVAGLDAARSAAFAAGVSARLAAADAPGSQALAADVDAMTIMLSHQGRARGLAPRLISVTVESRTADTAVLRVVDELPPYDFVTSAGRIIARSPGHGRQAHEVHLRLVSGQWRYDAVLKPPTSASSGGGAS